MKLIKAMATVSSATALSRVAGFIRDIMTANFLGAGVISDAFFVALKLPNLFRRITAEGAFSVSFVPLYSKILENKGKEKADIFANEAFSVMFAGLFVFTLVCMIAMPWIIYVIAPGFIDDAVRLPLAIELSRITFPYLLLMSLTALLGGVLNTHEKYAPFAFAPVIFNLCLISALLISGYTDITDSAGHALAFGILAAGFLQFFWLLSCVLKIGYKPKLHLPKITDDVKKVMKLMGPGVIGAGVMHVNLLADLIIASLLPAGAISFLYYADRLNQLPLGIIGIAVGTALLPLLSKAIAGKKNAEASNLFNRSMEICIIMGFPAAVALLVIPEPIVKLLFERGEFTASDTKITSYVLTGYAIGMPAYVCSKVLSSAYWAVQDTITPVKISIIATVYNIILSLILINFIGVAGIAVATGTAGWIQFALLSWKLKKQECTGFDERFRKNLPKIILSAVFMGAVLLGISYFLRIFGILDKDSSDILYILSVSMLILLGSASYVYAVFTSKALTVKEVRRYFVREKS